MVNFIMQEAHEKGNEIKIKVGAPSYTNKAGGERWISLNHFLRELKWYSGRLPTLAYWDSIFILCKVSLNFLFSDVPQTDHDFNLEKQQLVHNGKLKVQEEYAQKEKDLEVEQRV